MKKIIVLFACLATLESFAQYSDTLTQTARIIIHKDSRLDILGEKQEEINALTLKILARSAWGYRLQVLSTNDREFAMKTKTRLLQKFPEQKTYMLYQMPYLKLRFGNFKTKKDADVYKNQISRMLDGASVYYVSEKIEVKPEKEVKEEEIN